MSDTAYFPTGSDWDGITPERAGFDPAALAAAIEYHRAHETDWPESMYMPDGRYVGTAKIGDRPEHAAVIGPVRPRGAPNGLILQGGRIVAEWGDTRRADMTFSVTKSYLGLLAGLALEEGLIADLDRPVAHDVAGEWFESPHNAAITWRHLLQQTSEWQGTLWGKPDSADHNRVVGGAPASTAAKGEARTLAAPGTFFEYNDVRVNLLAACLTRRFGRALPEVLKQRVMDPIGASAEWEWHGYRDAVIEVDGRRVPSVSGGGHWGGGMFIGSRDHARMGLLVARNGRWGERQIIPPAWIKAMMTPSARNQHYGMMWWLNAGDTLLQAGAAPDSLFALGAGTSFICIDVAADLVIVARWIARDSLSPFLARIRAAKS
jgi:CubicO group peptidase (beta-lactamase class C family)